MRKRFLVSPYDFWFFIFSLVVFLCLNFWVLFFKPIRIFLMIFITSLFMMLSYFLRTKTRKFNLATYKIDNKGITSYDFSLKKMAFVNKFKVKTAAIYIISGYKDTMPFFVISEKSIPFSYKIDDFLNDKNFVILSYNKNIFKKIKDFILYKDIKT